MDSQDHKTTTKTTSDETAAAPAPDRGAARLEPDGSLLLTGLSLAPVPDRVEPAGVVTTPAGAAGLVSPAGTADLSPALMAARDEAPGEISAASTSREDKISVTIIMKIGLVVALPMQNPQTRADSSTHAIGLLVTKGQYASSAATLLVR